MNVLSYALLSMLNRKSCSGYELTKMMEVFWSTRHSQIYPLLAKLEQEELVIYEHVGQSGKPDKKIYTITDKGTDALKRWVDMNDIGTPVVRDEFLIKVYAIGLAKPGHAQTLFDERIAYLEDRVRHYEERVREVEEITGGAVPGLESRQLGRYLLFTRKRALFREELEWTRWARSIVPGEGD